MNVTKKSVAYTFLALLMTFVLVACGNDGGGGGGDTPPDTGGGGGQPAEDGGGGEGEDTPPSDAGGGEDAGGGGDAQAIIDDALVAMADLDNYHATIDMSFGGSQSGDVTLEVYQKGSLVGSAGTERPQFKGIVVNSTMDSLPADTVVVYGPSSCMYDPVQNVLLEASDGQDIGNSDLYNLFLGSQVRVTALFSENIATPQVEGEEQVGSFDTTKITFVPTEAAGRALADGAQGTVWIDKATSLPVKMDYSETGFETMWTVTDLSTDEIGDDTFASCGAPDDATVVGSGEVEGITEYASVDEATATAGFTPLMPDYLPEGLPAEPTGVGVQQTPLGAILIVTYSSTSEASPETEFPGMEDVSAVESSSITIRALNGTVSLPANVPGTTSTVTVRGQEGTLEVAGENQATLTWVEDGVVYTITGSGYGQDEVLQVAEGLM